MLFDTAAQQRIEATIGEVEQRTAAELVVVTLPRSDTYPEVRCLSALFGALLSGVIAHTFWPQLYVTEILWIQEGAALLAFLLASIPAVLRALLPARRARDMVDRRAREAFLQHGVFATRDRTGVLILISEFERRVVILGDTAIHEHVHEDGWRAHVQRMVTAIRAGKAADGVCEVLQTIGGVLELHFPVRPDDVNELSNRVRRQDA